jgi:hypothetical protein
MIRNGDGRDNNNGDASGDGSANNGSTVNDNSITSRDNDNVGSNRDNASGRNSATNGSSVVDNSFVSEGNDNNGDNRDNDSSSVGNSSNVFGDGATVSNAVLSSNVSGVTVTYGTTEGTPSTHDATLTIGDNAFSNANGVIAVNFNTARALRRMRARAWPSAGHDAAITRLGRPQSAAARFRRWNNETVSGSTPNEDSHLLATSALAMLLASGATAQVTIGGPTRPAETAARAAHGGGSGDGGEAVSGDGGTGAAGGGATTGPGGSGGAGGTAASGDGGDGGAGAGSDRGDGGAGGANGAHGRWRGRHR